MTGYSEINITIFVTEEDVAAIHAGSMAGEDFEMNARNEAIMAVQNLPYRVEMHDGKFFTIPLLQEPAVVKLTIEHESWKKNLFFELPSNTKISELKEKIFGATGDEGEKRVSPGSQLLLYKDKPVGHVRGIYFMPNEEDGKTLAEYGIPESGARLQVQKKDGFV